MLATAMREVGERSPVIGAVRAVGLAIGVDVVRPGTTDPDPAATRAIVEGMRERDVLIGTTGRDESTLKIRPPLVIRDAEVRQVAATLDEVLGELPDLAGRGT